MTWTEVTSVSTTYIESTEELLETLFNDTNIFNVSTKGEKGYFFNQGGRSYNEPSCVAEVWTESSSPTNIWTDETIPSTTWMEV